MIARIILFGLLILAPSSGAVLAVEVMVPLLTGEVYADGRPINRVVEVRFEAANSSLVASAYTFSSSRFAFRNITITIEEPHYLVIKEMGFKDLRYELNMNGFFPDSASPRVFHYGGSPLLELQSLPPEKKGVEGAKSGPKAIDARQLKSTVSKPARREYDRALENIAAENSRAAIAHLEKAVELAPDFYDALNKLGGEYLRSGRHQEAETILDRARTLNPNDALPLTNLGILYLIQGEKLDAASAANSEAGSEPPSAYFQKAADVFEKAFRLNPLSPRSSYYLGNALYKVGAYEKAESSLLNALGLNAQMHEARLALINVYTRSRRYGDALKQIAIFLDANPVAAERGRLESLKAQLESAAR